jgi:hypothetical protein
MSTMRAAVLLHFFRKIAESFSKAADIPCDLILDISDSYHREEHYMRGPGPKWRAKHQPGPGDDSAVFDFNLARARARRR